jgi:hypothetical protein
MTNCIINPEIHDLIFSKKTPILYTKIMDMKTWEITILKESDEGYLVSAPNGDTQWITKEQYQQYLNSKIQKPNEI